MPGPHASSTLIVSTHVHESTATSSSSPIQLIVVDAQLTTGYAQEVAEPADGLGKPVTRLGRTVRRIRLMIAPPIRAQPATAAGHRQQMSIG